MVMDLYECAVRLSDGLAEQSRMLSTEGTSTQGLEETK